MEMMLNYSLATATLHIHTQNCRFALGTAVDKLRNAFAH